MRSISMEGDEREFEIQKRAKKRIYILKEEVNKGKEVIEYEDRKE